MQFEKVVFKFEGDLVTPSHVHTFSGNSFEFRSARLRKYCAVNYQQSRIIESATDKESYLENIATHLLERESKIGLVFSLVIGYLAPLEMGKPVKVAENIVRPNTTNPSRLINVIIFKSNSNTIESYSRTVTPFYDTLGY